MIRFNTRSVLVGAGMAAVGLLTVYGPHWLPGRASASGPAAERAAAPGAAAASGAGAQEKGVAVPTGARVLTERLTEQTIIERQQIVGTVLPLRKSVVGSAVGGRVEEYDINEGEPVQAKQRIARLRTGIIAAEVRAAEAELRARQAELKEYENGVLPEELEQAQARLDTARAVLELRQANLARTRALGDTATPAELEEALSLVEQGMGELQQAQAALKLLRRWPREEKLAATRALAEKAQAELERLTEMQDRHSVFAPFDGFVVEELTEVGQWVQSGDPIAEIWYLKEVYVEIPVVEQVAARLRVGTEGTVEIPAIVDESTGKPRTFSGQVAILPPKTDARARTVPVKLIVSNEIEGKHVLIKPGMFARVELPVGAPRRGLLVRKDAIVLGGVKPLIYVVAASPSDELVKVALPRTVELGIEVGDQVEVRGEIEAGMEVIVRGNERVRPLQPVSPEPLQEGAASPTR